MHGDAAVYRPVTVRLCKGFTLLELLVVLLVIALLAGYVGRSCSAKSARRAAKPLRRK
ncbi:prepilin-type N-terminal cleavage/methylation domain-containing protein [Dyella sp.]|uniref:prepilin-type N-terminal cleavage/methylation domain-containing protein n=1 Tax=Dyella sp. TaxID=1869338 RepID=UPI0039C871C2